MPCLGPLHISDIADYVYDICPLSDPYDGPIVRVRCVPLLACAIKHHSYVHVTVLEP